LVAAAAYAAPMRARSLAPILVLAVPFAAVAPAGAASRGGAERAVERQVEAKFASTIEDRSVLATCRKDGRDRYRCTYRVLENFEDGYDDGANDVDDGIYAATGSAWAYVRKGGGYRVSAYRPRWI
jgi:hypothetical protein